MPASLAPAKFGRPPKARLVTFFALLLAACGGSDRPPPFTAQQVAQSFERVTGDELTAAPGAERGDIRALSLAPGADSQASVSTQASRYGDFTVFVANDAEAAEALYAKTLDGAPVRADRRGVRWRRVGGTAGAWQASYASRNVVVQWQAGERRRTTEQWRRLVAAIRGLTTPLERLDLPPADVPCERQGLDPAQGRPGTCKLGRQTLTVVDRGRVLRMPGYEVDRVRARTRRIIPAESRFSDPLRAKGRFVLLSFRVRNASQRPLGPISPTLAIGDARYAAADRAQLALAAESPFPVQPADTAEVTVPFDVPRGALRDLRRTGGLLVAGTAATAADLDSAPTIGRVRLAAPGPSAAARAPAPTPAPTATVPTAEGAR